MSKRNRAESDLVKVCLGWLAAAGIFAWRNNTGALRNPRGRPVRFGLKGSSDILGLLPSRGRFLAVECKIGTRLSESQLQFRDEVNSFGGLAVTVYSLEELVAAIEGAQRPGGGDGD